MDEDVLRAMLKWPNVPALLGWLRLDRRGHWYIRGERVEREALAAFIGRNYVVDEQGRWYFQNGPQRGYVALDYAPWILRAQPDGRLLTHTGLPVARLAAAFVDDAGSLLLVCEHGAGLLADADLDWAVQRFRQQDGRTVDDAQISEALERLQAGQSADLALIYNGHLATVGYLPSEEVPQRFGFEREPAA